MIPSVGRENLRPLTSLRFVAASLIVLLHVRGLFGISPAFGDPLVFGQGVSFFFVLSGFILTYVYSDLDRPGSRRFWMARIARIWPAHVAALLLLLLLLPASRPTSEGASTGSLLENLLLVHSWNPVGGQYYSYNSVSWSVSTELAFYLSFPVLLLRWRQTWHWKLALTLAIAGLMIGLGNAGLFPASAPDSQGFRTIFPLQVHPFARLFEFTIGMTAALAWSALASRRPLGFRTGSLCEILAVLLVMALMMNTEAWADAIGQQAWIGNAGWTWLRGGGIPALGFAILITVLALQQGVISRALSIPLFVFLGEISYSIYLVHQILVRHYLSHAQSFAVLPPAVNLALFIFLTLLISYLIWSLVENPLRALIAGRWAGRSRSSTTRLPDTINGSLQTNVGRLMSRPVVSSLAVLLAMAMPLVYLTMFHPSIDQVTPAYTQNVAQNVPVRFRSISFGGSFVLIGGDMRPSANGMELELVWESLVRQQLNYTVAVHVVDTQGHILSHFDHPQDPASPWVDAGVLWSEVIHLSASHLDGASAVAIGLYRPPEGLQLISRGPRDWEDRRLLIPLKSGTRRNQANQDPVKLP